MAAPGGAPGGGGFKDATIAKLGDFEDKVANTMDKVEEKLEAFVDKLPSVPVDKMAKYVPKIYTFLKWMCLIV